MHKQKLFMILLGCRPAGRYTEQHDVFFGIGNSLKDLVPAIKKFWPEAKGEIHIDAWREVACADGYSITVEETGTLPPRPGSIKNEASLFFINLGGYKENEFDEFHYKMLVVANNLDEAKSKSKKTAFFKHTSLANSTTARSATAHIDDKYGIDVDDVYPVKEILAADLKEKYRILIVPNDACPADVNYLGYLRLKDL